MPSHSIIQCLQIKPGIRYCYIIGVTELLSLIMLITDNNIGAAASKFEIIIRCYFEMTNVLKRNFWCYLFEVIVSCSGFLTVWYCFYKLPCCTITVTFNDAKVLIKIANQ